MVIVRSLATGTITWGEDRLALFFHHVESAKELLMEEIYHEKKNLQKTWPPGRGTALLGSDMSHPRGNGEKVWQIRPKQ